MNTAVQKLETEYYVVQLEDGGIVGAVVFMSTSGSTRYELRLPHESLKLIGEAMCSLADSVARVVDVTQQSYTNPPSASNVS